MNKKHNMTYKRLTITLPKETIAKLKQISKKENRTMSNMIRQLIEDKK